VDRSSREGRSTGPQPPLLQPESGDSRRHQSCSGEGGTTAGEFLKPIMWPIIRSTPDARPGQPQTKKRKCGIQPAHQSLFTDVFGSRLLLCTIHQCKNFTMTPRGDGKIVRCVLDWGHQSGMALIWIGGMVFFGLGGLLFKKDPDDAGGINISGE